MCWVRKFFIIKIYNFSSVFCILVFCVFGVCVQECNKRPELLTISNTSMKVDPCLMVDNVHSVSKICAFNIGVARIMSGGALLCQKS